MKNKLVVFVKLAVILVMVALWVIMDIFIWNNSFSIWTIGIPLVISLILAWMVKFKEKE